MRQVILFRDEDGKWIAECPSLPGCISQGDTEAEALSNIREAITLWVEDAREHDEPVPADTDIKLAQV